MIDIHDHLLWGLDDGSTSVENSVEMARMAVADGITHVVCTPHANEQYPYDPRVVAQKIATLQRTLYEAGIDLKLGQGCDFHMSYDNIQEAKADPARFSINGHGYLLIELPDYGISPGLVEILYQLRLAGLTPILTHPERNATLQTDQQRMVGWMRGGLLVQVTAGSVTGHMGKAAQRMAHQLLAPGCRSEGRDRRRGRHRRLSTAQPPPVELLEVGRIGKPHGLAGEVAVDLTTNVAGRLDPGSRLVVAEPGRERVALEVVRSRPHGRRFLVTFAGITDRTAAERLTNATLLAPPSAVSDEIFVHELIGATVLDGGGVDRGAVVAVEANPASDLLVLDSGALVPMRFVVRFADGIVTVDAPDGLFE